MPSPEVVPAISAAEKLAEAVKQAPNAETKQEIDTSTADQLNDVAKVIEEKRIVIDGNARALIKTRFDILRSLETSETTDKMLADFSSRVYLMRLLEIPAPITPSGSSMDTVASFLHSAAEHTKGIPVINFVTGALGKIKGRTIERVWYNILATFEKNPVAASTAVGVAIGPLGSMIGALGLDFGGRKRLLELDILDAIDGVKIAGEKIKFAGTTSSEMAQYKDKLVTANVADLTAQYVRDQRKILSAGSEITVTLSEILNPEKTKSKIAEKEVDDKKREESDKKKNIIDKWGSENTASVTFGTPVGAKKNAAGMYEITIPEAELKDGLPISAGGIKLQEAIKILPEAKEIIIVGDTEPLSFDLMTKTIRIPSNISTITDSMNRAMGIAHDRVTKIVFATPVEMPTKTMKARYDSGTLLLGAHSSRLQAIEQFSGLAALLEDATPGQIFEFKNGSWSSESSVNITRPT